MNISAKNKGSSAEPKQIFRQFAWNLASTLSKTSAPKKRSNAAKKRVRKNSKTEKKGSK